MARICFHFTIVLGLLASAPALRAAPNDWAEYGATRDYYNSAGMLKWKHKMGDWYDAGGTAQGNKAYATATIGSDDKGKFVEWDVSPLVHEWLAGKHANQGIFLRAVGGGGTGVFASRESAEVSQRPQLVVTGDKDTLKIAAQADTYLTGSTYQAMGRQEVLKVANDPLHALIRFDLGDANKVGKVEKAVLRLYHSVHSGNALTIGVFRCSQGHDLPASEPILGLAAKYPGDKGIAKDPAVVFFSDFEAEKWAEEWSQVAPLKVIDTVNADPDRKFEPLQGKALRAKIEKGATTALNTSYKFKQKTGAEPEEIYFRYYLRLGDDWNQTVQGGKMPGISGDYGVAGWGGRKPDGTDGWSARGAFYLSIPKDNPLAGRHPIGTYCYHADQEGHYGDIWLWQNDYRGFLEKNRWYCLEQFIKLNTPGMKDGVLRAWVDGRLAFEKTDIRFRLVDKLKIERIWLNVYHGGTTPSPHDQHVFIGNVVIAKSYIGPMKLPK
jgi:hypothetical protein